ncbi:ribosome small subunit-dependent GTPase A [Vibrio sp. SCSIO 43137]|uniref:ribosome small subunit-dependent GTPase A n=1 Tax=Vibrio sp. SCSIO 43137 TaxID=3021011 RepID=UPI0023078962|nr:ribosome small subunit-dependent GTPase A [Vibrio sp. SCSIO 43137]WCE31741.1 ribosome small subunit-dependent GTPase A [Vibrio sp. SCSIO 43137]
MSSNLSLPQMGWQAFFQQQLTLEEYQSTTIARIAAQHRSGFQLLTEKLLTRTGTITLPQNPNFPPMTVGDWILLDQEQKFVRCLERSSLFQRKAAGTKASYQLIAANIDTLFIVCSLNDDFNLNRIERYLALANEAQVEAVVVLTKADLCKDAETQKAEVQKLDPMLMVETVNALDSESVDKLSGWCKQGKTVAVMGSSGVGKSTLLNTLMASETQLTGGIREDDSKGRHTTTSRSLHQLPHGGLLIDTPGMRELQLTDCEAGVSETFSDIEEIARECRFSDCQHQSEPRCAIQSALSQGTIDERRLNNYFKLLREQARNSATLAEQRAASKQFGKMVRSVQNESRYLKKGR